MKNLIIISFLAIFCSCTSGKLIKDKGSRERLNKSLEARYELFGKDSEIFSLLKDKTIPQEQREALEFLYAYSPITDMNVEHEIIKGHVAATFKAREEMSWGKEIPEALFLHYVLPARINNEILDSSRVVFYNELRSRVEGLSMADAALEVNHWCHEKAVYGSSDARTLSPLELVRSAVGRCGEESVFAIAAMRAVGIPARQVYTPRWAHSDDNHAWVEIWTTEGWKFLGACEPAPALNMGWFAGPASRALITHARVFGDYVGEEDIVTKSNSFTTVNNTPIYAETKRVYVKVLDQQQNPVEDAKVEFRIYNYAELYPAVTLNSDNEGLCSITLGLGELVVWASKDDKLGIKELTVSSTDTLQVTLNLSPKDAINMEFNLTPPSEGSTSAATDISEEQREISNGKSSEGNRIRKEYIATFPTPEQASELAKELGVDEKWLQGALKNSRGNHQRIVSFLKSVPTETRKDAVTLLTVVSKKDLMDISVESLIDHLNNSLKYKSDYDEEIWSRYILNPRISTESVTPYKEAFAAKVGAKNIDEVTNIAKAIKIADEFNTTNARVKPIDVAALGVSDNSSRDIYFVALARSIGVPARLEESSSKLQYYDSEKWIDVNFGEATVAPTIADRGELIVNCIHPQEITDPQYYKHFSFAKMDGVLPKTISMRNNMDVDMGGGSSSNSLFNRAIKFDVGNYIATSGTRNSEGEVAVKIASFDINKDQATKIDLVLRESIDKIKILAKVGKKVAFTTPEGSEVNLSDLNKNYAILALVKPNAEPTNHSLRAIKGLTEQFKDWDGKVLVAVENSEEWGRYNTNEFGELPISNYLIDSKSELSKLCQKIGLKEGNLPYYLIISNKGEVIFTSEGYQINLGDNISKIIEQIK